MRSMWYIWILYTHTVCTAVCCAAVLCCMLSSPLLSPILSYLLLIRSHHLIWNLECAAIPLEHMSPSRRGVLDVFHVPRNLRINIYPEIIRLWNMKFLDLGPWTLDRPEHELPSSLPPVWRTEGQGSLVCHIKPSSIKRNNGISWQTVSYHHSPLHSCRFPL